MLARKEGMLQRTGSWRLPQRNVPLVPGPTVVLDGAFVPLDADSRSFAQ